MLIKTVPSKNNGPPHQICEEDGVYTCTCRGFYYYRSCWALDKFIADLAMDEVVRQLRKQKFDAIKLPDFNQIIKNAWAGIAEYNLQNQIRLLMKDSNEGFFAL